MANTILNIGKQTPNLLSNENLIVYQDISMKSKFNAAATSNAEVPMPLSGDYVEKLASEHTICLSNGSKVEEQKLFTASTVKDALLELTTYTESCWYFDKRTQQVLSSPNLITHTTFKPISNIYKDIEKYLLIYPDESYVRNKKQYINKLGLAKYRVDKNINVKAVQNSLHNIFTWIPGERILNPEFGSILYKYLYNGITDYNTEQIMAEIRKCISEWEPRVQLEEVRNISTIDDTENNTIHLEIIYTIPSLNNEQYSYTYIYHKRDD